MRATLLIVTLSALLTACADWPRNVYEGVRQRQQAVPDATAAQPVTQPDYKDYKRELDKLKSEPTP